MGWFRAVLAAAVMMIGLAWASPALAQDDDPDTTGVTVLDDSEEAQPESGVARDEDTSAAVRQIRRDLIVIAVALTLGLVVYVWHTSPARRVRVAALRAESVLDAGTDTGNNNED